ncbi:single-stranded DNA-binding protein [Fundicoccus ignavus]|uniref:Single-stranded DNA-binding protein n=1 Tax=Fundicoccus ignavus TaxID=2664442 RepID=A0A6I2GDZ1_9LACT|nr:single-stranded DNA-binding protein [Fundicoccus ignavus]MRI81743.1 single-stranded DNA-binding protein [Fundicoccus ignavus]MRI86037.1 single-stranded DNA-binding protein [Fundicoccus ignavus]MRJ47945.1 single-stranded DNA-binding protein [Fundicoccus ignavus]
MNTVQLVGRLTKEVDLKFTSSGTAVGSFTIAVNRSFTNQQGDREADFINCVIWRKAAENLASFTRKGSQIGIEGRIQTRNYENQQGQRVYVTEVVVNNFHLLEPRSVTEQRPAGESNAPSSGGYSNNYNNQNSYQNQSNFQNTQSNQSKAPQNNFSFNQDFNQQSSSPFMEDGRPIDISEDDLPF